MYDIIYSFIEFWSTPAGLKIFLSIKYLLIFISFFFVFWIVFFLVKSAYLWNFQLYKETLQKGALPKGKIPKKWQEISSRIKTAEEANCKLGVIEADVLLDDVLKKMGYSGETMSERIERITQVQLKTISEHREAHSVRNNILHNPNFKLTSKRAEEVIELYEKVLKEIDIM